MQLSLDGFGFLIAGVIGSYFIARIYSSGFGDKLAVVPSLALEIALGFVIVRIHPVRALSHSPAYFLGEAGVVAIVAAGGSHVFTAASRELVKVATKIASLGVTLSVLLVSFVLVLLGSSLLSGAVFGLALAPSSAGVATRVLLTKGANRTRAARTFFFTAVFDDILGLVGLAIVEVLLARGATRALVGLGLEVVAVLFAASAYFMLSKKYHGDVPLGAQVVAWLIVGVASTAAASLGASPIVIAFVLVVGFSRILRDGQITQNVERGGLILLPLFFVSLGGIAGTFYQPSLGMIPAVILLVVVSALAKVAAARLAYGSQGFFAVGSMLMPRAEITFVIALAATQAQVLSGAGLFEIALVCVVLGTLASVLVARLVPTLQ